MTPHYSQDSSKPKWKSIVFLLIKVLLVSAVVKLNSTQLNSKYFGAIETKISTYSVNNPGHNPLYYVNNNFIA